MDITLQAQILSLRSAVDGALSAERDVLPGPSPEARWVPGERLSARVEAALPGGRFHVRVDDLLLEMHLPEGFRAGDRLELEFVSAAPRPSFLLKTAPDAAPRPEVELSASSRNLGEVLKSVAPERTSRPTPASATPVKEPAPLLPAATPDPARLAQALSGALGRSGLFYESHQAQWILGQRPMADLLHEPQGRLSPATGELERAGARAESRATVIPQEAVESPADDTVVLPSASDKLAAEAKPALAPVHPQTLPQVRSQLDVLETRQLVWQGQLWPGQALEWHIGEPGEEADTNGELQPWFTQLRLRLPRLGELSADLALVGPALRVRLIAADGNSQAAMREAHPALAESLSAAGIDLVSFKVKIDGQD